MSESFSWLSLDADEEVVWSGRPRLHVLIWVVASALVVPALLLVVWPTLLSALLGAVALVAIISIGYLYVTNIDYVVSTKYVYSKWGVLGRSVTQIGLHNIQDTTLSQGIFGTHSDYGTVSFSTAGGEGSALAFYLVDEPSAVKSAVDRQVSTARKEKKAEKRPSKADGVDELLLELRASRKAAQRIDQGLEQGGTQS